MLGIEAIAPWRDAEGYCVPAEFVVAVATRADGKGAWTGIRSRRARRQRAQTARRPQTQP
jgi:hypothetical protein